MLFIECTELIWFLVQFAHTTDPVSQTIWLAGLDKDHDVSISWQIIIAYVVK